MRVEAVGDEVTRLDKLLLRVEETNVGWLVVDCVPWLVDCVPWLVDCVPWLVDCENV